MLLRLYIAVFALILLLTLLGVFESWELQFADQRFQLRGPQAVHPDIAHIDIDTEALKAEGNWNDWTTGKHALIVNILARLGAGALGMDIFFTERAERLFSLDTLGSVEKKVFTLADISSLVPDMTALFADAMTGSGRVVLAELFENQPQYEKYDFYRENREKSLEHQRGTSMIPLPQGFPFAPLQSNITPVLAPFAQSARAVGFAQVDPDKDGVVRRYAPFFQMDGQLFASLGLMTVLAARGMDLSSIAVSRHEAVFKKGEHTLRVPLRADGTLYINWRGDEHTAHPRIPYSAVKWLGYNIVLREMKAIAAKAGRLLFDRERFLQLPEIEKLQREFGDGTPLAGPLAIRPQDRDRVPMVEEVWSRLVIAELTQNMLDKDPDLAPEGFIAAAGLPDDENVRDFFLTMKYANMLMLHPESAPAAESAAAPADRARFAELQAFMQAEKPDVSERPYFFYPAPIVESAGGFLYSGWFKDKICFYGLTASGTHDLNPIPLSGRYPMVGVHANIADNILSSNFLIRLPMQANIILMGCVALLGGFAFKRTRGLRMALAACALLAFVLAGDCILFVRGNVWLDIAAPAILLLAFFVTALMYTYLGEEREKKQIRGAFSRYVSPALVSQIMENPGMLKLGGEKRVCTVFFSDIAGFTTLSEGLAPERLVELLNIYLTEVTDIILAHGGMLDKYEGDAVMAVFGAPLPQQDHAARACRAALAVQARLLELRARWRAEGSPEFITRIGLNSGEMVVGNMGSRERFDYTVIGDAVNLGSRLEGANKQYGTYIMISDATRALAGEDAFVTRELDLIRVKGKAEPVRVYELLDEM
jgi:class 3 adenylate cyclase/CHASE2 domain-containing sensor protein